jgi:hypothetical protein
MPLSTLNSQLSTQRRFHFPELETAAPLLPLSVVMALTKKNEDDALWLVTDGLIQWAFHIESPDATRRQEIRVLRDSLLQYLQGNYQHLASGPTSDLRPPTSALSAIITTILPPLKRDCIRGRELARRWSCSPTHIITLLQKGALTQWPGQTHRAPKETPMITRQSAADFLRARALGYGAPRPLSTINHQPSTF